MREKARGEDLAATPITCQWVFSRACRTGDVEIDLINLSMAPNQIHLHLPVPHLKTAAAHDGSIKDGKT